MDGSVVAPALNQSGAGQEGSAASGRQAGVRPLGVPFAAGMALLSASLANFLHRNEYGFFRLDVAIVLLCFAAICAAMAVIYRDQRQWGRSLLEGFLVFLVVDLNSSGLFVPMAAGAAVVLFTIWRRISLLGPLAIIGSFVLVTTVLGFQGKWTWIRTEQGDQSRPAPSAMPAKPAVLHLILDEHLGLEGFSALGPEGVEFRNELEAAYAAAGFTLFGRAYSEHMHTVNAIPQVLNYGERPGSEPSLTGVEIGPTEHLQTLAKSGYALKIFQSDFADICSGASYASCTTYDSFSMRPLMDAPLTTKERSTLIVLKLLTLSKFAGFSIDKWNEVAARLRQLGVRAPGFRLRTTAITSSVATFAALGELDSQLAKARPGEAFVVHLLVPHYPYVVSRGCELLPRSSWDWRNSASPIERKQRAYMEQIRCVTAKVLEAVRLFRSSPGGRNGAIVIHGDHGSRITRIDPMHATIGRYGDADLIAGFSTFFAVHAPGGRGGYVGQPQPVTPLVRDFARRGFKTNPVADPAAVKGVYLDDHNWQPRERVPLPDSWMNPASPDRPTQ